MIGGDQLSLYHTKAMLQTKRCYETQYMTSMEIIRRTCGVTKLNSKNKVRAFMKSQITNPHAQISNAQKTDLVNSESFETES